jgi:hypothetical protein
MLGLRVQKVADPNYLPALRRRKTRRSQNRRPHCRRRKPWESQPNIFLFPTSTRVARNCAGRAHECVRHAQTPADRAARKWRLQRHREVRLCDSHTRRRSTRARVAGLRGHSLGRGGGERSSRSLDLVTGCGARFCSSHTTRHASLRAAVALPAPSGYTRVLRSRRARGATGHKRP